MKKGKLSSKKILLMFLTVGLTGPLYIFWGVSVFSDKAWFNRQGRYYLLLGTIKALKCIDIYTLKGNIMTARTLVLILLVLLLLGAFPAFSFGGVYGGGLVGTLIVILLVLLIAKRV